MTKRGVPRRRLMVAAAVALGVVGVITVLALRDAWHVSAELKSGAELLEAMSVADLGTEGVLEGRVSDAADHFRRADSLAHSSRWLSLIEGVPLVGRQIDALRDLSSTAAQLASIGDTTVDDLSATLNEPAAAGPRRLEVLTVLGARIRGTEQDVGRIRPQHHTWLAPPIASAEQRLDRELRRARSMLATTTETLASLRSFLTGPSRLLVLAGSNAEMRAGMGMPLHAGIVTIDNGTLQASPFQATSDLILDEPMPIPRELRELYGWLDPGIEWRNVASSPNFPMVGPVFAGLARRAGLGEVDGVISVDVRAIADLLGGLGPVEVYGVPLRADNTERLLLQDVYLRPALDGDLRHQVLGTVAEAVLTALDDRPISARELAAPLVTAAQGRHLMVWARDPSTQEAWESLGVAGELDAAGLLIAVQSHGGYKLDWYLRPEASLDVEERGDSRRVEITLDIDNAAPAGLPDAVAGSPLPDLPFGSYRAFVTFYLPGAASQIEVDGRTVLASGFDGPMQVVAVRFDVALGSTESVRLSFEIPDHESVRLLPSARVHPIVVRVEGDELSDATAVKLW